MNTNTLRRSIRAARSALVGILLLTTALGAWSNAMAQPRISTQPRNVAILPGQNAEFRVGVSTDGALAYQWRFNGTPLAGATTNSLTVTNAALAQLGRYDVEISNSAGAVISTPAWLLLATRWTEFIVFGASDAMESCDGPGWTGYLANRLGVPLRNYAEGGADSPQVRSEISSYLQLRTPTISTLVGLSGGGGGMDLIKRKPPAQAASNHLANVRRLAEAGARNFLLLRMWPSELVPGFRQDAPWMTNELQIEYEALLDAGLEALRAEYPLTIYRPNLFVLVAAI